MNKTFKQLPKNHEFRKVKLQTEEVDDGFVYYVYPAKYVDLPERVDIFRYQSEEPIEAKEIFQDVLEILLGNESRFQKIVSIIQLGKEIGLWRKIFNRIKKLFQ